MNRTRGLRGYNDITDEEQLLLEQEQFSRAGKQPAAKVTKVDVKIGSGPPQAADGAAHASPLGQPAETDGGHEPTLDYEGMPEEDAVLGEVVDRDITDAQPQGRGLKTVDAPFPVATHRKESQFSFSRRRKACNVGTPKDKQVDASAHLADPTSSGAGLRPAAGKSEAQQVDELNKRRLREMTPEQVEAARQEVMERLPASTLDFLRNRRKAGGGASCPSQLPAVQAVRAAGVISNAEARLTSVECSHPGPDDAPTPPPTARIESDGAALAAPVPPQHATRDNGKYVRPPPPLQRVDEQAGGGGARASTSLPHNVRFGLAGEPVGFRDAGNEADGSRGPEAALLRDPLREEEAGGGAVGYTLEEAATLTRSSVPAQRVAGCRLLAAVMRQARPCAQGLGQDGGWLPCPLPPPFHDVAWSQIWEAALGPCNIPTALRIALDDGNSQVIAAAGAALHALLEPSAQEQRVYATCDLCPLTGFPVLPTRYLERPHAVGAWVAFPLEAEAAKSDDDEPLSPSAVATADPLSGLLQMGVLDRISYGLFSASIAGAYGSLMGILGIIARGGPDYCAAIFNCAGLLDGLLNILDQSSKGGNLPEGLQQGFARARLPALRVLRLMCESHRSMAISVLQKGASSMIQTYLGLLSASLGRASNKDTDLPHDLKAADADLMVEALHVWRAFAQHGIPFCSLDDMFPVLCTHLLPPAWHEARHHDLIILSQLYALATSLLTYGSGHESLGLSDACAHSLAGQLIAGLEGDSPSSIPALALHLHQAAGSPALTPSLTALASILAFLAACGRRWGESTHSAMCRLLTAAGFGPSDAGPTAHGCKTLRDSLLAMAPSCDPRTFSEHCGAQIASAECLTAAVLLEGVSGMQASVTGRSSVAAHLLCTMNPETRRAAGVAAGAAVRFTPQQAALMQAHLPTLLLLLTCLEVTKSCVEDDWAGLYLDAALSAFALLPPGTELLGLRLLTCIFRAPALWATVCESSRSQLEELQHEGSGWTWVATRVSAVACQDSTSNGLPQAPDPGALSGSLLEGYAASLLGFVPESGQAPPSSSSKQGCPSVLQPVGSRLPPSQAWMLEDIRAAPVPAPHQQSGQSLSRIDEDDMAEESRSAAEAPLFFCLGLEGLHTSFLADIDPGVKAAAVLELVFRGTSVTQAPLARWSASALLRGYCEAPGFGLDHLSEECVRRWLHTFATASYGDPLLGTGVLLLLLPATPANIQELTLSLLVEENCLHLLPIASHSPLPASQFQTGPVAPKALKMYADMAWNGMLDQGLEEGGLLPQVVAYQLGMAIFKGLQRGSPEAGVLLRNTVRWCRPGFVSLLLAAAQGGVGTEGAQSMRDVTHRACESEPALLSRLQLAWEWPHAPAS